MTTNLAQLGPAWSKLVPYTLSHRTPCTPDLCLANIDLDMPWLGGTLLFPRHGNVWEDRGKNLGEKLRGIQQVLNPTPLNPAPATCHKRKRKLRCNFRNAALQKLHCNIGFSAVRKSFGPKAALQQTKNCTATSKKLRCRKVALSCRFPAGFKPPRLGTHVSDLQRNFV